MYKNIPIQITKLEDFENKINYTFENKDYLITALSHSSYANDKAQSSIESNERFEFFGDSIVNFIVSKSIFLNHSELSEGNMTRIRANIVCETSLKNQSVKLEIGEYLILGKGEVQTGGRKRASILADAFEAITASIYLDGGIKAAEKFVLEHLNDMIEESVETLTFQDYKTKLQEMVNRNNEQRIAYEVISEKGPDHNKIFVSQLRIDGKIIAKGSGKNKKEAAQNAAKYAVEHKELWSD